MGEYEDLNWERWKRSILVIFVGLFAVWAVGNIATWVINDTPVGDILTSRQPAIGEAPVIEVNISVDGANSAKNEPVAENESKIPKWWYWSEEDWQKFREYANETEVIWEYNQGEKIGTIIVAGKPLVRELSGPAEIEEPDPNEYTGLGPDLPSPITYFERRHGPCGEVAEIVLMLFTVKQEQVTLIIAKDLNWTVERPDGRRIYAGHAWVEWTDKKSNEWTIDHHLVMPIEKDYQTGRCPKSQLTITSKIKINSTTGEIETEWINLIYPPDYQIVTPTPLPNAT